ncbi:ABC transporter permease [Rhizobium rhizogenes]|uniref:ABC transporter permease n=1 Tax=Rhizobium rhizogenes TaxID=359 RepID=UPI001573B5AE|nr:ABC transporter permease [Rhizobium rhizogenes]NTI24137.1 ABC transporter permease [Rhizobium rhizogenes]QTG03968.1 ABC transporter permease [Rhizobium rhizogenes]
MDLNLIFESIGVLADGVLLTLALTLLSLAIGFVVSVPLSFLRASSNRHLSGCVLIYTYVFRGTPLLVQLFLIYYGLGQLEIVRNSMFWPLLREPFWCALLALSLNSAAYTTEVFRAGIQAVPRGVVEAAQALGLSRIMQIRLIIFPLAFRTVLPSYANEVIGMLKASSLASTVTLLEITGLARRMVSETFAPYEIFLAAGLIYLFLTFVISKLFQMLETHLARSTQNQKEERSAYIGPARWRFQLRRNSRRRNIAAAQGHRTQSFIHSMQPKRGSAHE